MPRTRALLTATSLVAALAAATALPPGPAAQAAQAAPAAPAGEQGAGFNALGFRSPGAAAASVFVSGLGWTNWRADGRGGAVGSPQAPVALSACFAYRTNTDRLVVLGDALRAFTPQAPGRQGFGVDDQVSFPLYQWGSTLRVSSYSSRDCTSGQRGQLTLTMPSSDLETYNITVP